MKTKNSLNSEFYDEIQDLAIADTKEKNILYFYRKVCRWYSKTFFTPLHIVHTLSWDFILTNYYESIFEDMKQDQFNQLVKERLATSLFEKEELENIEFAKNFEKEYLAEKSKLSESYDKVPSEKQEISLNFNNLEDLSDGRE